jgi:hypothetical protein
VTDAAAHGVDVARHRPGAASRGVGAPACPGRGIIAHRSGGGTRHRAGPRTSGGAVLVVIAVLPVAVLLSLMLGGRLRNLERAPLGAAWLLAAGLAVRVGAPLGAAVGILPVRWADHWTTVLLGHLAVGAWIVVHRHLAGTGLLLVGVLGEALAALAAPAASAGLADARGAAWMSIGVTPFPLGGLPVSLRVVDLVTAAGVMVLTHTLMTYRPAAERRRAALEARLEDPAVDDPWGPRPTA